MITIPDIMAVYFYDLEQIPIMFTKSGTESMAYFDITGAFLFSPNIFAYATEYNQCTLSHSIHQINDAPLPHQMVSGGCDLATLWQTYLAYCSGGMVSPSSLPHA
jgi:hypothetical protein